MLTCKICKSETKVPLRIENINYHVCDCGQTQTTYYNDFYENRQHFMVRYGNLGDIYTHELWNKSKPNESLLFKELYFIEYTIVCPKDGMSVIVRPSFGNFSENDKVYNGHDGTCDACNTEFTMFVTEETSAGFKNAIAKWREQEPQLDWKQIEEESER